MNAITYFIPVTKDHIAQQEKGSPSRDALSLALRDFFAWEHFYVESGFLLDSEGGIPIAEFSPDVRVKIAEHFPLPCEISIEFGRGDLEIEKAHDKYHGYTDDTYDGIEQPCFVPCLRNKDSTARCGI